MGVATPQLGGFGTAAATPQLGLGGFGAGATATPQLGSFGAGAVATPQLGGFGTAAATPQLTAQVIILTISVLQAYSAVITAYAIPSDSVRKSTVPLQIKISTAQLNFSNRNVIIF